ncbi:hypothetical protein KIF59_23000 [Enterobacter cloacae subsp. cloacae]|nr:hypothetical protein [Enterobacter cloacae subsp. cloacae]
MIPSISTITTKRSAPLSSMMKASGAIRLISHWAKARRADRRGKDPDGNASLHQTRLSSLLIRLRQKRQRLNTSWTKWVKPPVKFMMMLTPTILNRK